MTACDKISLPRLGFEEKPQPRLPHNITYAFSNSLLEYTKTVDACGLPYTVPVGQLIAKTFMKIGQERLNTVRAEPPVGEARGVPPDGYRIVLGLNQYSFNPTTKIGDEDRYLASVDMQMQVIYEDPTGTALAQSPLTYQEQITLWTPALSGQSTSCTTTQIDQTVEDGADVLARQMISVLPRLSKDQQTTNHAQEHTASERLAKGAGPAPSQIPLDNSFLSSPAVQFRTKLIDANRNLVLEAGEALALFIETTNVSKTAIPSAYVEIRGTPALVQAFKRVAPLPVPLGELKAGKKRTTEIRGRLGRISKATQGELIIGIILSEGLPPSRHTIHAELYPTSKPRKP